MSRTSLADLSVVVVNYGSTDLLRQNLAPVSRVVDDLVVVVVDNWSGAAERVRVTELATAEGWLLVTPDGNEGFGTGVNLGVARAQAAGARHHVLLNPDAVADVGALSALLRASSSEPLTMSAPTVLRPDGSVWSAGSDLYLDDGRIRSRRRRIDGARVDAWLSGACLVLSDELWRRCGGFDDDYFLYWEDVDLSRRVVAAGGALQLLEDVTVVHAEGGTQAADGAESSGQAKSAGYYRHNIRNRLLFAAKHLGDDDLRRWRRVTPTVAWEVLLQGGRRQFVRSPGTLLVGLRAVLEGRRLVAAELRRRRS
ncbi:glycosyltransferase family 2 protein [Frigoribacterium sp. ACAM 257]|uniref:glycosyltransferase family 2 protein n=1 Tax=Frigoribacterium sp. ACAM 257 TaxID=2508998 RepID=UPI0011B9ECE5|nr:glycosyltransferase family 2 protein [Frigoribacterium sp. ACAM 257]TWX38666.1 glycosyltransferase family 2 protein [Frigoribacterium sp. ACAM 257]